jgi:hypothetical protein
MHYERIEMTLAVKGEVRATAYPLRNHESIERQRNQWYFFYGLKSIMEWEIYISYTSKMQNSAPFRIEKPFPYHIKQNQNDTTESGPTDQHCEPVNPSGGSLETVGRGQGEVL